MCVVLCAGRQPGLADPATPSHHNKLPWSGGRGKGCLTELGSETRVGQSHHKKTRLDFNYVKPCLLLFGLFMIGLLKNAMGFWFLDDKLWL